MEIALEELVEPDGNFSFVKDFQLIEEFFLGSALDCLAGTSVAFFVESDHHKLEMSENVFLFDSDFSPSLLWVNERLVVSVGVALEVEGAVRADQSVLLSVVVDLLEVEHLSAL